MNDYEMADCLANLLNLNNESTEMFDTMNAEDACRFIFLHLKKTIEFRFKLGQFIENQLPEQVTLQTFMEDLLKMPSQYVEQVMYYVKAQQQQRHRSSLVSTREKKRQISIEQQQEHQQHQHQHQQRLRSATTATTQSTTSASNES